MRFNDIPNPRTSELDVGSEVNFCLGAQHRRRWKFYRNRVDGVACMASFLSGSRWRDLSLGTTLPKYRCSEKALLLAGQPDR